MAAAALIGSGMTLVDPNLLGILAPAMFLCSRATCLLTVLFLVNVLGQYGQLTLMPWWRCRMWALRLVS